MEKQRSLWGGVVRGADLSLQPGCAGWAGDVASAAGVERGHAAVSGAGGGDDGAGHPFEHAAPGDPGG